MYLAWTSYQLQPVWISRNQTRQQSAKRSIWNLGMPMRSLSLLLCRNQPGHRPQVKHYKEGKSSRSTNIHHRSTTESLLFGGTVVRGAIIKRDLKRSHCLRIFPPRSTPEAAGRLSKAEDCWDQASPVLVAFIWLLSAVDLTTRLFAP